MSLFPAWEAASCVPSVGTPRGGLRGPGKAAAGLGGHALAGRGQRGAGKPALFTTSPNGTFKQIQSKTTGNLAPPPPSPGWALGALGGPHPSTAGVQGYWAAPGPAWHPGWMWMRGKDRTRRYTRQGPCHPSSASQPTGACTHMHTWAHTCTRGLTRAQGCSHTGTHPGFWALGTGL